jgi:putative ubiquitin-RnfH superfamily antitoxin RatB of RatAB toxin-antitoxin module
MATRPELPGIEVVYARPDQQRVVGLPLTDGLTALAAVRASGLLEEFPELDAGSLTLGIWGRPVPPGQGLRAGDRVEVYRPLGLDPREARRAAARAAAEGSRRARARRS